MLTFPRNVQALLYVCLPWTSGAINIPASFAISVSNTSSDGRRSVELGSTANIIVDQQPYSGIHNWTVDSVTVYECIISTCGVKKASDPKRYLFRCDTTSGRFAFTIHPVEKTDNGKVIGCYDGKFTRKITLNVTGKSDEGSSGGTSDLTLIQVAAVSLTALFVVGLILIIYRKRKQIARPEKRQTTEPAREPCLAEPEIRYESDKVVPLECTENGM